ncbi:hypothetical protein NCAS_0H03590 [Naumovozyma castellii]|uniref:Glucose-6-phosphate 1-dehydrogenase n=1 Tax=Naumovozyma castellii TaxID=27288 RepID=G0VJI9_NAUCA|nr:hypothetical protein NCAS_0H03590 [Naumovozyma castellii CBS 4309]CCC71669.1 hypothetical protein NCAS_0H03590 [Naumovozyma castellii CBS 4309]
MTQSASEPVAFKKDTVLVIFGASGDLAKKETFPALFGLYSEGALDPSTKIICYARSNITVEKIREMCLPYCRKSTTGNDEAKMKEFFKMVSYVQGAYDTDDGYIRLRDEIESFEAERGVTEPHRVFYLAVPPSIFLTVAGQVKKNVYAENGITRVIVEKPFGDDLESSREMQKGFKPLFRPEEIFKVDHFLGKDDVRRLLTVRFANPFLNQSWNKDNIESVQVWFKEPFGAEGRGGFFDSTGIIRDVMQNHLLQILTLATMEEPIANNADAIRDAKVDLLKCMEPLGPENIVALGQYGRSVDGTKPSYLDDDTVLNKKSNCLTFTELTFAIHNDRWEGVPIVMRAGKGLDEDRVEIRIKYKKNTSGMFKGCTPNEFVIHFHPKPTIYMTFNTKAPGFDDKLHQINLDMTYAQEYKKDWVPEAYECLIKDAFLGNSANYVRDDELDVSWALFTPLLKYVEGPNAPEPEIYPYGSTGPKGILE